MKSRRLTLQPLESRQLLAADAGSYCLPAGPLSADGAVATTAAHESHLPAASAVARAAGPVGYSPYDPSGDRVVTPLDALQVLSQAASVQRGEVVLGAESLRRFDVNGDDQVTPLDALLVLAAISQARRSGFESLTVPGAALVEPIDGTVARDLSVRLELPADVDAVFAAIGGGSAVAQAEEITQFRHGDALVLSHDDVIELLGPIDEGLVSLEFWTHDRERVARTALLVPYRPPPVGPPPVQTLVIQDAEQGVAEVIDRSDGSFPLVQSAVVSAGEHAFHLAHPRGAANWFALQPALSVQRDTKLFFMSRLGWAMAGQVAQVQVSTDGGASWPHTLYSQSGSGDSGEGGFVLREVDLGEFAGQAIQIRFIYQLQFGSYFPQSDPGIGWYVDDIQVGNQLQKQRYQIGDPSAEEQLYLEYINRARADALAEAARLAAITDSQITRVYDSFGIDPRDIIFQYTEQVNAGVILRHAPPLSFHGALLTAAELHSQDLLQNGFQGHTSSANPPAPFQPGDTPSERAAALGYNGGVGENVYSHSQSVAYGHAAFAVDWGGDSPSHPDYIPLFAGQGMQNPAAHRRNLHDDQYKEIGIGVVRGTNGPVGPQLVTQNFGRSGDVTFITGVVYEDLNANAFYDVGEGRPGVRVDVEGSGYYAISTASGGYSVPVSGDGQHVVTFSGGGYADETVVGEVTDGASVKIDYRV